MEIKKIKKNIKNKIKIESKKFRKIKKIVNRMLYKKIIKIEELKEFEIKCGENL